MHVFVTVVQWGSMAKAAQQLNVTQPAVSKAIGDLDEHTLGVRLLDRRPPRRRFRGIADMGRFSSRNDLVPIDPLRTALVHRSGLVDVDLCGVEERS